MTKITVVFPLRMDKQTSDDLRALAAAEERSLADSARRAIRRAAAEARAANAATTRGRVKREPAAA